MILLMSPDFPLHPIERLNFLAQNLVYPITEITTSLKMEFRDHEEFRCRKRLINCLRGFF